MKYSSVDSEYIQEVFYMGKIGTGPGEFGVIGPMEAEFLNISSMYPDSLVVNSKKEIYILDHINNRIQKYDKEGYYLKSIPVLSCADKNGKSLTVIREDINGAEHIDIEEKPYYNGKNIMVSSENEIYYYLTKGIVDGEKENDTQTGEIWRIVDDEIIEKIKSPANVYGMTLDNEDQIWIGNFNLSKNRELSYKDRMKRKIEYKDYELKEIVVNDNRIKVEIFSKNGVNAVLNINAIRPWIGDDTISFEINGMASCKISDNNKIYLRYGQGRGNDRGVFVNEYDINGKLLSVTRNASGEFMDNEGKIFNIAPSENNEGEIRVTVKTRKSIK
ncbi:MAG: hypothetical protein ABII64_02560 [Elusimicrobiota bacterium]